MRAIIFEEHGGPDVLKSSDVPGPQLKADEVLVEVRACALNHLDVWVRNGLPGIKIPLPHNLGNQVDGVAPEDRAVITWVTAAVEGMIQPGLACPPFAAAVAGRDHQA